MWIAAGLWYLGLISARGTQDGLHVLVAEPRSRIARKGSRWAGDCPSETLGHYLF